MKYKELLKKSETAITTKAMPIRLLFNPFKYGGEWMTLQQKTLFQDTLQSDNNQEFTSYGILKYGLSVCLAVFCCIIFSVSTTYSILIFIITFYLVEVHFLFLFPLLINGNKNPVQAGIRLVYTIGFWRCFITTLGIAKYMISGLTNSNSRFLNWHIGCLAILIWYHEEA